VDTRTYENHTPSYVINKADVTEEEVEPSRQTDHPSRKGVEGTRTDPVKGSDIVPEICCLSVCSKQRSKRFYLAPYRQEDIQEQPEPIILENEEIQNSNTELPDHVRELLEHEEKNCLLLIGHMEF
jgi:hypothetical protein